MKRWMTCGTAIATAAMLAVSQRSLGQGTQQNEKANLVMVGGGAFFDDVNADDPSALGSLRLGRILSRYFIAELVTGYTPTATKSVDLSNFAVQHTSTPFAHADLAIEAQIPWMIAPYVGVASGVFHRSGSAGIQREQGASVSAAVGARAWMIQRLFVQGEFRARQDRYRAGDAHNVEMTLGLGGSF